MKAALLLLSIALLAPLGGCNADHLETGYVYAPLGDSSAKRRGYYADPFSPEARAAQQERAADAVAPPRPIPGQ